MIDHAFRDVNLFEGISDGPLDGRKRGNGSVEKNVAGFLFVCDE